MNIKGWLLGTLLLGGMQGAFAQTLPAGFQRTDPILGRAAPTGVYFAHDGRVFVTEKSGQIWVYQNLLDPAPQLFADLRNVVHDFWDRGLLGFALDPRFPEVPYVYAQYAFNGGLGLPPGNPDTPPRWPGSNCPNPPGATTNGGGCVISGRVSRFPVTGNTVGAEQVLVEDWYQQFPSHSIGTIMFGPDGYLYAGGGDGASFNGTDFGQWGNANYPDQRAPLNQGGALRSQGLEIESQYNAAGHDVWLSGTISRIDPASGLGVPGNPLADDPQPNAQRIIAYGLRNPFRFTFRPGSNGELWVGDVGYGTWEEVNVIPTLADGDSPLKNFGWPCFEGRLHTGGYSGANLAICNSLYTGPNTGGRTPWTPPWYTYQHVGGSDITGLAFYEGTSYPAQYQHSFFFADNSRTVIFNIPYVDANGDGMPDPPADSTAGAFFGGATATAVQLTTGPGGDVFFVNINNGRVSRISYCNACTNVAPSAAIALDGASSADGAPRDIGFTAANSVDPDADVLDYSWDLDGDGAFDDASGATASAFFAANGAHTVSVQASDGNGGVDVASMIVTVTNNAPTVSIVSPAPDFLWSSGELFTLSGTSSDAEQGTLPDSAMHWQVYLESCENPDFTDCSESLVDEYTGATATAATPQTSFPAYLRIVLTGVDEGGLGDTKEVAIYPATAEVTLQTVPAGLSLHFNGVQDTAPFTRTAIVNASFAVFAPSPQAGGDRLYVFESWSDGGEAGHIVQIPDPGPATLTATFFAPADIALGIDDGLAQVTRGQTVTWTLVVNNPGLNNLAGVLIEASLPAALHDVQWTCTAGEAGSSCSANGSGALSDTAAVWSGGSVTYLITGIVGEEASGSIVVGASATIPPDYVNQSPDNDSASDSDLVETDLIFADGFDPP
jgi:uncharacterized repeat protein (TIGR01451 family)